MSKVVPLTRRVALKIKPDYVKALVRKAQAHEKLGDASHLEEALEGSNFMYSSTGEDYSTPALAYKKLYEIEPKNADVKRALATLPVRIEQAREKEKEEMIGRSQYHVHKFSESELHPS